MKTGFEPVNYIKQSFQLCAFDHLATSTYLHVNCSQEPKMYIRFFPLVILYPYGASASTNTPTVAKLLCVGNNTRGFIVLNNNNRSVSLEG